MFGDQEVNFLSFPFLLLFMKPVWLAIILKVASLKTAIFLSLLSPGDPMGHISNIFRSTVNYSLIIWEFLHYLSWSGHLVLRRISNHIYYSWTQLIHRADYSFILYKIWCFRDFLAQEFLIGICWYWHSITCRGTCI